MSLSRLGVNQCGEMKLLLSSLLLASLCALSSWSVSSETVVVTQSPDQDVMEGKTVNITCCWKGGFERAKLNWLKNHTDIKRDIFINGSRKNETSGCSNLTFINITREDSGNYTCRVSVDIPYHVVSEGSGTVITVTDRNNVWDNATGASSNSPLTPSIIICLAVVALLFLITLTCFCILWRRQARAARVIYEVPHIDSEVADMDKHSTGSSTGSSQWCQVPVYESFDYFERVQTKESG